MKTYQCTENDNRIRISRVSEQPDDLEIMVGTCLESDGFVVIGLKDLKNALREAGETLENTLKDS